MYPIHEKPLASMFATEDQGKQSSSPLLIKLAWRNVDTLHLFTSMQWNAHSYIRWH
jgi:hypothetical protein